jgi:hypothetical protein
VAHLRLTAGVMDIVLPDSAISRNSSSTRELPPCT